MADIFDKETRSYVMSRIRSKDTKPELQVRKYLFSQGFRYRLHEKKLPGTPDITLPKYHTVIFVHGCFWHGHKNCKYASIPKTRTEFWMNKIARNKMNDRTNIKLLKSLGWQVLVIHECQLKKDKINRSLKKLVEKIN
ncbi:MAG: DNA mismatch endonuclease Vsr [Bacteroidota bacterium]